MYCQKCGTQNADEAKFCVRCGNPLKIDTANIANSFEDSVDDKKKNHIALIIIIIILVIFISIFFITKSIISKIKNLNPLKIDNFPSVITNNDQIELPDYLTCKSNNCHTFTIYFLENINNNGLNENYKSFSVEDGTVLNADELVKYINNIFKLEIIKTDGEIFTLSMGGFSMNIGWYYKDTTERFNFNEPITKDTEIEMKLFDGAIDNDILKDIYDILAGDEYEE